MRRTIAVLLLCLLFPFCRISAETADDAENEKAVVTQFLRILRNNPREGTALDRVFDYHRDNRTVGELLEQLENEAEHNPTDVKKRLLWGLFLEKSGRDDEAFQVYRRADESEPDDFYLCYYLGRSFLRHDMASDAVVKLERALADAAPNMTARINVFLALGRAYVKLGDLRKFDEVLQNLMVTVSLDEAVLLDFIKTLEEEKLYDEAIERYSQILKRLDLRSVAAMRTLLARADAMAKAHRKAEAVADYEFVLHHVRTDSPLAETTYARIEKFYATEKAPNGLVEFYEKRLVFEPGNRNLACRYANALVLAGQIEKAERVLAEVSRTLPENDANEIVTMLMLARLFGEIGKPEDAEALLRKASVMPINDPAIAEQLAANLRFDSLIRLYNKPGNETATVRFYVRSLLERSDIVQQPEWPAQMFNEENNAGLRDVEILEATINGLAKHAGQHATIMLLENRLARSRRSLTYLMQKVEKLLAEDETESVDHMLEEMGPLVSQQPEPMLEYAALLDRAGHEQASLNWKDAVFRIAPQRFFQDDNRHVREYKQLDAVDQLCDLLRAFDHATLLQHSEQISRIIDGMMGSPTEKSAGVQLFDELWNKNFAETDQRLQYKTELLKGMIWNSCRELFPYDRDIVLTLLVPANDVPLTDELHSLHNPHWVVAWGSDQCRSLSLALLATLPKEETPALVEEVDRILARHESMASTSRDWPRYTYTVVMKALLELKMHQPEHAFNRLKALEKNEHAIMSLIYCGAILGQEFAGLTEEKYRRFAMECFQKYQRVNRHSYGEVYLGLQLQQLQTQLEDNPTAE